MLKAKKLLWRGSFTWHALKANAHLLKHMRSLNWSIIFQLHILDTLEEDSLGSASVLALAGGQKGGVDLQLKI